MFRTGEVVRVPKGAIGRVVGITPHGSIRVHLPLVDMTFPYAPADLHYLVQVHDGRACALAGRAKAGHPVSWSDVCGPCYLNEEEPR